MARRLRFNRPPTASAWGQHTPPLSNRANDSLAAHPSCRCGLTDRNQTPLRPPRPIPFQSPRDQLLVDEEIGRHEPGRTLAQRANSPNRRQFQYAQRPHRQQPERSGCFRGFTIIRQQKISPKLTRERDRLPFTKPFPTNRLHAARGTHLQPRRRCGNPPLYFLGCPLVRKLSSHCRGNDNPPVQGRQHPNKFNPDEDVQRSGIGNDNQSTALVNSQIGKSRLEIRKKASERPPIRLQVLDRIIQVNAAP